MLIGRESEQKELLNAYHSDRSEFIAVYGRRRVGKTYLIRETFKDLFTFQFTGVANVKARQQINRFRISLKDAGYNDCPILSDWFEAFDALAHFIKMSDAQKKVIFLDEMPWMDSPRSSFIQALESFWNGWASTRDDIVLIACGSATSWIINKVINNHGGLHNRLTHRIWLKPFTLRQCKLYAENMGLVLSQYQILEGYMVFGGIPFYWSLLNKSESMSQNIDRLFFSENGELKGEFDLLYASLFKEPAIYINVVKALGTKKSGLTREELIKESHFTDNGKLSKILEELEYCGFIRKYNAIGKKVRSAVFQLIDNYTLFYFKFISKNNNNDRHFWTTSAESPMHRAWCGLAFERVCLQHVDQIKAKLGISGVLSNEYSWRSSHDNTSGKGAQIDLLIDRNDQVINLCEMKFSAKPYSIDKKYEEDLREKRAIFIEETATKKAVHLTMITTYGLQFNQYSSIAQSEVIAEDLFS